MPLGSCFQISSFDSSLNSRTRIGDVSLIPCDFISWTSFCETGRISFGMLEDASVQAASASPATPMSTARRMAAKFRKFIR